MAARTKKKTSAKKRQQSAKGARPDTRAVVTNLFQQRFLELKARYDAAQTNDDNRRHWSGADALTAAEANRASVRFILRNRSRYECDNNAYAAGIIRTRADDLIGTGPTLQIPIDDDETATAIEQAFSSWARAIRLAEKLHTMDMARARDGEVFALLIRNERLDNPVMLDIVPIEADRVQDTTEAWDITAGDGIEYDEFGNPTRYTILRNPPQGRLRLLGALREFDKYSAEFVCHWFRKDRPGQLRGIPELTPSLELFAIMRRWTLATVLAAETAANFALMLETEASPNSDEVTTPPTPFEALEIERNMMTALPTGTKANQLAAEHPNTEYADFKWELLAECARPIRMPANVAAGDTSRSNFASAKIDHLGYRAGNRVDRQFCEWDTLDKIYRAWLDEARRIPGYLPGDADPRTLPHKWYWPGWASWDKQDAKQDTEMLTNGTTTLAELLAEWGLDWREVVSQRGKEIAFMEEQGVPPPSAGNTGGPGGDGGGFGAELVNRLNGVHKNGNGRAH